MTQEKISIQLDIIINQLSKIYQLKKIDQIKNDLEFKKDTIPKSKINQKKVFAFLDHNQKNLANINKKEAAKNLGISRQHFYRLISDWKKSKKKG